LFSGILTPLAANFTTKRREIFVILRIVKIDFADIQVVC